MSEFSDILDGMDDDLFAAFADDADYTPADGSGRTAVRAIVEEAEIELDEDAGVRMRFSGVDLLIRAAELGRTPQRGDTIDIGAVRYKALPRTGEGVYTWEDPDRTVLRIHAQEATT